MSKPLDEGGSLQRITRFIQLSPWREAMMRLDDDLKPDLSNLVSLTATLPLPVWATVVYDPARYLIRAVELLPTMPAEDLQKRSTGATGEELLDRSMAFVRSMLALVGSDIFLGPVVELGPGWGRMTRLMLKYVDVDMLDGLDPLPHNVRLAHDQRLPGRIELLALPVTDEALPPQSSLIFASQLFLRLSPEAFETSVAAACRSLAPGGSLVLAVRPPEYWLLPHRADPDLVIETHTTGVAHVPSDKDHLGETAVTLTWLERLLGANGMGHLSVDWNTTEPYLLLCHARRII